ncbi:energy transducer TonB [Xanthomarina sp. F2636L]|uniref:energy transducer TonB n=1 Tax=Xanthomarina sp. F2636L TaxID=2996018 RepID=UPI00225DEE17|nr:energy transducer TonB [Xanthomarina sp. F2636L]MCX7550115.1 energy transducer TonB [Xanthomarina sp. F2636L]
MKPKKNPNVEVGRNSGIYFAIGLNVMLLFAYLSMEHKTFETSDVTLEELQLVEEFEEDIPITELNAPPPPPPPPVLAEPETITVVEDAQDIEETVLESTETSQEEKIDEPVVEVQDVQVEEVEEDVSVPFSVVEKVPIYPGCIGATNKELKDCFSKKINDHIIKNFKYPQTALDLGIYGRVIVLFIVDKNGNVTNIKSRGPDKMLEQEAERIIGLLPTMKPGLQRGNPVSVPYSIPINFKIQN